MLNIYRTNSDHSEFKHLITMLDEELAIRDGEDAAYYSQYNTTENINHVIIGYKDELAVACGALKPFDSNSIEIKRMFVVKEQRGNGIGKIILAELEKWATELNYTVCVLETGKRQPEAIQLYKNTGYEIIPNYGQYKGIVNSICFKKTLSS